MHYIYSYFLSTVLVLLFSLSTGSILADESSSKKEDSQPSSQEQKQDQEQAQVKSEAQPSSTKPSSSTYNFKEEDLKYINSWISMRPIIGKNIFDGSSITISAEQGVSYLIFFISSWCTSCKTKINEFKKLQDTHEKLYTKVIYAFSHDTMEDARAFSKKHDIQKNSVLVDDGTIGAYSNPHIPSIFVVDRKSWIIDAYQSLDPENLADIDEILNLINSY